MSQVRPVVPHVSELTDSSPTPFCGTSMKVGTLATGPSPMLPRTFYLGAHYPNWLAHAGVPLFVSRRALCSRRSSPRALGRWAALDAAAILLAPGLPWIPVLQGWTAADYWRHVEMYDAAGISLQALPLVGVGSLCRRQALSEAGGILSSLFTAFGLDHLHGFGFKISGLRRYSPYLASADSMAWSKTARYTCPLAGCPHRRCNNCLRFALLWRSSLPEAWL